ncbi:MAG: T9SS type A sorting domain-containing protein [Chryseobacterium sp.]|uniref:T9SS type A sorting domain-containing protein n=1 Tax=Chryseobacterium sp. TaxID=1871047 RepID=UPI003D138956
MKKILLLAILVIQNISAQIVSKDNLFASNGIYSTPNYDAWSKMVQNSDGNIYFTYTKNTGMTPSPSFLSKLTATGTIDTTFGNNGEIQLPYTSNDSQLKMQQDGKLLIQAFTSDANINYSVVIRILPNGQLDNTFGVNGIAKIADINPDLTVRGYGLVLQNNKIIVYGQKTIIPLQDPTGIICRLNENGSIDTTFGMNGFINNFSNFNLVALDNQSNIIGFGYNKADPTGSAYVGAMAKYNADGQLITGFGNTGIVNLTFNPGYIQSAILDSNNNIIFSSFDPNAAGSLNKINANGTFDPSFTANFNSSFSSLNDILSIVEKNGYYYIGGMNYAQNGGEFFISKIAQNGQIDPVFNYFVETDPNLTTVGDMIINDNNIIANGSGYIVKYLLNSMTLATTNPGKSSSAVAIENPVSQNLIFTSKDRVTKIEIFSVGGQVIKTIKDSHSSVSDLSKGIYTAKVTFENGNTTSRKLIKN